MANFTGASELREQPNKLQDLFESATAAGEIPPAAVTVAGGRATVDNPWVGGPQLRKAAVCWSRQPSHEQIHEPRRQEWPHAGPSLVAHGRARPRNSALIRCWSEASPPRHSTETTLLRSCW